MHDLAVVISYIERKSEKYLPTFICPFSKFDIELKDIDLACAHVERNSNWERYDIPAFSNEAIMYGFTVTMLKKD